MPWNGLSSTLVQEWLERADWSKRSPEFGELVLHRDDVHMELRTELPSQLWDVWTAMPAHPSILRDLYWYVGRFEDALRVFEALGETGDNFEFVVVSRPADPSG
jgi:hypothetical protein